MRPSGAKVRSVGAPTVTKSASVNPAGTAAPAGAARASKHTPTRNASSFMQRKDWHGEAVDAGERPHRAAKALTGLS